MARYLLQNIHEQFPEAKLGLVVASRGDMIRDLCASTPWITVIEANRKNVRSLVRLWKEFHSSDFTVTQYSGKVGGRLGFATKIAARLLTKKGRLVGFKDASAYNSVLFDILLPVRADIPVVEHEREALRAAGIPIAIKYPALPKEISHDSLDTLNLTEGGYLIAHFFAGNKGRSLRPEKAHALLVSLRAIYGKTYTFLVSGSAADRELAERIADGIPDTHVIAGDASLQEMMGLISGSAGVVSVDTGIAHLTAHVGRPLVVLRSCLGPNWWFTESYGPQAPIVVHTREDVCAPHQFRDYPACLDEIDLTKVHDSVKTLFSQMI